VGDADPKCTLEAEMDVRLGSPSMTLDLLVEGRIATLAGEAGFGWVEAIGVTGGRVVAAGPRADLDPLAGGATRRLALAPDEIVLPALRDAHIHLVEAARTVNQVDLSGAATLADGLEIIAAAHRRLPDGAWLEGTGWDVTRWGEWPTATDLDRVVAGRPAFLWSHELHQVWADSAALAAAGIDATTSDPPDGRIRRDETGQPTGMLHEGASKLVTRHAPEPTREWLATAVEAYCRGLLAYGIVAVHDLAQLVPDVDLTGGIAIIRDLADGGRLPVRVHASIRTEALGAAIEGGLRSGAPLGGSERARFGWLKIFGDGSLFSRTAFLLEPWELGDERGAPPTGPRGLPTTTAAEMAELANRAAAAGIATAIHAIGDATVRSALDALAPVGHMTTVPNRIEHLQFVDPSDVGRFHPLGVVASVQPIHLRGDARWARAGLGDRAERIGYPWRAVEDAGGLLAFGADAPYEDVDPWPGLAMAVTRSDPSWSPVDVFGLHEAITLDMAVRAHCLHPALAAGERDRGRLAPGHQADLMVVPAAAIDEPTIPGGPLARARPRLVLEAGEVAFER
jgi:predicted amidohydrolase YtcJ